MSDYANIERISRRVGGRLPRTATVKETIKATTERIWLICILVDCRTQINVAQRYRCDTGSSLDLVGKGEF